MRGYRFMDAVTRQNSLMMMPGTLAGLRGKQCMTDVDPVATMRQHTRDFANKPLPGD